MSAFDRVRRAGKRGDPAAEKLAERLRKDGWKDAAAGSDPRMFADDPDGIWLGLPKPTPKDGPR